MGAKLSGPSGKGAPVEQNADINVTPFVDVMLVLLIIFMVSAPLATVSIRLDLPPPPPVSTETPPPPTFISIATDGQLYITTGEGVPAIVALEGIDAELLSRLGARDERVLIRADADVMYNDFMTVMNYLQDRGWLQVGLINEDIF